MLHPPGLFLPPGSLRPENRRKAHRLFQGQFVSLDIQIADSIRIITWNKNEVYVKASVDINDDKYDSLYNFTFDGSGKRDTRQG